jgi:hypothetical protein
MRIVVQQDVLGGTSGGISSTFNTTPSSVTVEGGELVFHYDSVPQADTVYLNLSFESPEKLAEFATKLLNEALKWKSRIQQRIE